MQKVSPWRHGGSASSNGELNKLYPEDRPAHDWYRFVLSFPPHLVRGYIQQFLLDASHCVLDPFCGTGTTLVECKKLGVASVGIEANPMAHFASRVKVDWSPDPDGLLQHSKRIAEAALAELKEQGIEDTPLFYGWQNGQIAKDSLWKLDPEAERLLLVDSISPLPLHKTLVLLNHIQRH